MMLTGFSAHCRLVTICARRDVKPKGLETDLCQQPAFPTYRFPNAAGHEGALSNYFWVIRCLLPSQHPCLLSTNLHPTDERVAGTAGERTLQVLEKGEQGEGGSHKRSQSPTAMPGPPLLITCSGWPSPLQRLLILSTF